MTDNGYWFLALGLGLVAAAAAVVLLQLFLIQVWRIEKGAEQVWQAGKEVARNTATTWMLNTTADRVSVLAEEAGKHEQLLESIPPARTTTTRTRRRTMR